MSTPADGDGSHLRVESGRDSPDREIAVDLPLNLGPTYDDLHRRVVGRIHAEAGVGDTVTTMLVERIATQYVLLVWKDANADWLNERARREEHLLFGALLSQYREAVRSGDRVEAVRAEATRVAARVIDEGLKGLHSDVAGPLRGRFADAMERVEAG